MGVHKDSELGTDGDIDGRRASPSLVIGVLGFLAAELSSNGSFRPMMLPF